jgi:hypothetical protein
VEENQQHPASGNHGKGRGGRENNQKQQCVHEPFIGLTTS